MHFHTLIPGDTHKLVYTCYLDYSNDILYGIIGFTFYRIERINILPFKAKVTMIPRNGDRFNLLKNGIVSMSNICGSSLFIKMY